MPRSSFSQPPSSSDSQHSTDSPTPNHPEELAASPTSCVLLAVDVGLRTGLAGFDRQGRPLWQRSHHVSSRDALKRLVRGLLHDLADLEVLVIEGGGPLATIWGRAATRRGLRLMRLAAEDWRSELLLPREQRSGQAAKDTAVQLARQELAAAGIAVAGTLRHDAAEAVLLGIHTVRRLGWREI